MNQVNFLPESYRRAQQRRGRTLRQTALVGATLFSCVLATVGLKAKSHGMAQSADRLEETVDAEQNALGVIGELEKQHASLTKRTELKKTLMPPVAYHQAIAAEPIHA